MVSEQQAHLAGGALFIVDHAGRCPEGIELRDFQKQEIHRHLTRHIYYYRKNNQPGDRTRIDTPKMLKVMADLQAKHPSQDKSFRRKTAQGETSIDALFRMGSRGIDGKYLEKIKYDRDTFLESSLPSNQEEDDKGDEDKEDEEDEKSAHEALKTEAQSSRSAIGRAPTPEDPAPRTSRKRKSPSVIVTGEAVVHASSVANNDSVAGTASPRKKLRLIGPRNQSSFSASPLETADPQPIGAVQPDNATSTETNPTAHTDVQPTDAERRAYDAQPQDQQVQSLAKFAPSVQSQDQQLQSQSNLSPSAQSHDQHVQPPVDLNLGRLERELQALRRSLRDLTYAVLNSIGDVDLHNCSLVREGPSKQLTDLHERCWGHRWPEVQVALAKQSVFTSKQVTIALISAFLYDNILDQQAWIPTLKEQLSGVPKDASEAILEHVQQSGKESFTETLRYIRLTNARESLALDEAILQDRLTTEAQELAARLWTIILPHLRDLSSSLKFCGLASNIPEEALHNIFQPGMTEVIVEALQHRLNLQGTGYTYTYTWPNQNDAYKPQVMQIDGGRAPDSDYGPDGHVLFTVFPGLTVRADDPDGNMKDKIAFRAAVKRGRVSLELA